MSVQICIERLTTENILCFKITLTDDCTQVIASLTGFPPSSEYVKILREIGALDDLRTASGDPSLPSDSSSSASSATASSASDYISSASASTLSPSASESTMSPTASESAVSRSTSSSDPSTPTSSGVSVHNSCVAGLSPATDCPD